MRWLSLAMASSALDYLFARGDYADRDPADLPAMVLLDLNLPRLDGQDVLQQIRQDERTKLLPVVILTSSNEDKERLQGLLSGEKGYLRKPVDFAQFADAVKQLGLYWLVTDEPPSPTDRKIG